MEETSSQRRLIGIVGLLGNEFQISSIFRIDADLGLVFILKPQESMRKEQAKGIGTPKEDDRRDAQHKDCLNPIQQRIRLVRSTYHGKQRE